MKIARVSTRMASAALAVAASTTSFAQAPAPIATDGQWRGVGGLAVSVTSGNSSTRAVLLNADAYRATAADKITVGALVNYGRANSVDTSKKWLGFGQYDWNLTPRMFAFGRLGLEGDALVELDRRMQVAGGVGYKVIQTPNTTFTAYGGMAYTADKYGALQFIDGRNDTSFKRTSLYLAEESTHKLSDTTSFKQRLDLYPGLTGDKAFLARWNAGLAVAMSSTLSMNVGVLNSYNSKPPLGAKKNDLAVFTGINVKLGAN